MPWSDDNVERAAKSLDAMAALASKESGVSTKEAVEKLATRVWKLRSAGRSWEAIAEGLSAGGEGVAIKAATLRSYLRGTARSTKKKTERAKGTVRKEPPRDEADPNGRSAVGKRVRAAGIDAVKRAPGRVPSHAPKEASRDGPAVPAGTAASKAGEVTRAPGRGSFEPRRDTHDL